MADPRALDALRANPPGLPRYLALHPEGGETFTDSRDLAQEVAGRAGGTFVEREPPAYYQRGAFALSIHHCRACTEGVCTLNSHRKDRHGDQESE